MNRKVVGILGGCKLISIATGSQRTIILDVGTKAPAKQILAPITSDLAHTDGSFRDPAKVRELAARRTCSPSDLRSNT
jgi:phosphoribosylaminoimidazole carboxylase